MVMIFSSEKARNQLMGKGFVFTFRKFSPRKLGKGWINEKRGGKKIADVIVSLACHNPLPPIPSHLQAYVSHSGFDSVEEWIEEIVHLNKPDDLIGLLGEVFCVVKI